MIDSALALLSSGAVLAALCSLLATIGMHIALVGEFAPRGTLVIDSPWLRWAMYAFGAGVCAGLTYWVWQDLDPPPSAAMSAAWGLAHPLSVRVVVWAAGKRWPGLVRSVGRD